MAMAPSSKTAKKGGRSKKLAGDAPWRTRPGEPPIPRIAPPALVIRRSRKGDYALSIMKHPDPIGMGLASEAMVEAAGPDCIIPGLVRPVKVLGFQVWPIGVKIPQLNFKALEPIGVQMRSLNKLMERAFDLTQAPLGR